jgi:hypothetical protein
LFHLPEAVGIPVGYLQQGIKHNGTILQRNDSENRPPELLKFVDNRIWLWITTVLTSY